MNSGDLFPAVYRIYKKCTSHVLWLFCVVRFLISKKAFVHTFCKKYEFFGRTALAVFCFNFLTRRLPYGQIY